MFYWRRQACMRQRQARSSSVTVSACTVPERQNRRVYHGKARVPTNQMQQHHYFLRAKIWNLPRNGRMPTNQMRAVHVRAHGCHQNLNINFYRRMARIPDLESTHGGETYLSWGALSFASKLKLTTVRWKGQLLSPLHPYSLFGLRNWSQVFVVCWRWHESVANVYSMWDSTQVGLWTVDQTMDWALDSDKD